MAIQLNDTQYIEVDIEGLLDNERTGNKDEPMTKLLEKNSALVK